MQNNKTKQKARLLLILFVLSLVPFNLIPTANALVWGTGVTYNCDNEYYSVTTPITVDNISISTHWFSVNGIGFNISYGATRTFENLSSIISHPRSSEGWIMNWTSKRIGGGTIYYDICGLKPNHDYILYSNVTTFPETTDASGIMTWSSNAALYPARAYKIYDAGIPDVIYVSLPTNVPPGSDATGTGSITAPYATIRKAINVSTTSDTIVIRGGTYQYPGFGTIGYIRVNRSGTRDDPYTIRNYPGETVVIDGGPTSTPSSYAMFVLYKWDTNYYHNITFEGLNFSNADYTAIYGAAGSGACADIKILNCSFYNIGWAAVRFYSEMSSVRLIRNILVDGCNFVNINMKYSWSWTGEGATCMGTDGWRFSNNTIGFHRGIFVGGGSGLYNVTVENNTFHQNYSGACMKFDGGSYGTQRTSNIIVRNNYFWGTITAGHDLSGAIYVQSEIISSRTDNISIYNNVINITAGGATDFAHGIQIRGGLAANPGDTADVTIHHNTVYITNGTDSDVVRLYFSIAGSLRNVVVANNILMNAGSARYILRGNGFASTNTAVLQRFNNVYNRTDGATWTATFSDGNNLTEATGIVADPECGGPSSGDFTLNGSSPAIDAGSATYGIATDILGTYRPVYSGYDCGAYEYTDVLTPSFVFSAVSPANTSTGVVLTSPLQVHINEAHGYKFNYTIKENTTGAWLNLATGNDETNDTFTVAHASATAYSTKYWWRVTVVNGTTWHNETYFFTTLAPATPSFSFSLIAPVNGSIGQVLNPDLDYRMEETHGYKFNYTIKENTTGVWSTLTSGVLTNNFTGTCIHTTASSYSTKYWWKITAWNGSTLPTTAVYHFTTMAAPVTDITLDTVHANWTTTTSVNITWSKGTGATNTYVYRKNGDYINSRDPLDPLGVLLYNGLNSYYNDTALDPTVRYHYTLFPYDAASGVFGKWHNVSLAETGPCWSMETGASWIDFQGYMATDKNIRTRFNYANDEAFTLIDINTTTLETEYLLTDWGFGSVGQNMQQGQRFKTGATQYYVYNITIRAKRLGLPGILYCNLTAAGANLLPTGAVLSSGTLNSDTLTTDPTGGYYNITMSPYYLAVGTSYCFILSAPYATGVNQVSVWGDTTGTYANGQWFSSTDWGASYVNMSTPCVDDLVFRIWGKEPESGVTFYSTSNTTVTVSGAVDILQDSFNSGQLYYYRYVGNDTAGNMTRGNVRSTLTRPDVPIFIQAYPRFSNNSINISWIMGTGANRTVIVDGLNEYPDDPSDGTIEYNGTGTWAWIEDFTYNASHRISLFSFTIWGGHSRFSSPATVPWGGIAFNCYNESSGLPIGFNMLVTNKEGTESYYASGLYGWSFLNVSAMPTGEDTAFFISNSSGRYNSRLYYFDINDSTFYNLSFYLPPDTTPYGGCNPVLFSDTFSVVTADYTVNKVIDLTHNIETLISVEVYNKSVLGGAGGWVPVPSTNYTVNDLDTITINHTFLASNTTFVKITYYYCSYGGNDSYYYLITVINEAGQTLDNVYLLVRTYIGTMGKFVNVSSGYTDGNGQYTTYLMPNKLYKINCSKAGYDDATFDYIPSPSVYTHTLKMYFQSETPTTTYLWYEQHLFDGYMNNATGRLWVNYSDYLGQTSSWELYITRLNPDGTSTIIFSPTGTNNSFSMGFPVNTSYDYHVLIWVNHTTFGRVFDEWTTYGYHYHPTGKASKINLLMSLNFGWNPFGWANTIGMFIILGVLFSFGRRETYMSALLLGVLLLFLDIYIGFPTVWNALASGFFPILIIFIGILMMIRDRGMWGSP